MTSIKKYIYCVAIISDTRSDADNIEMLCPKYPIYLTYSKKKAKDKLESVKVPNTYIEGCDICEFQHKLSIN